MLSTGYSFRGLNAADASKRQICDWRCEISSLRHEIKCLRQEISDLQAHSCKTAMVPIGVCSMEQASAVNEYMRKMFLHGDCHENFSIATPPVLEEETAVYPVLEEDTVTDNQVDEESIDEQINILLSALSDTPIDKRQSHSSSSLHGADAIELGLGIELSLLDMRDSVKEFKFNTCQKRGALDAEKPLSDSCKGASPDAGDDCAAGSDSIDSTCDVSAAPPSLQGQMYSHEHRTEDEVSNAVLPPVSLFPPHLSDTCEHDPELSEGNLVWTAPSTGKPKCIAAHVNMNCCTVS